jgi:hypothetical protein
MKKRMLSLAAMLAALSFATPAQAELKLSGDASVRLRGSFTDLESNYHAVDQNEDDLLFQYRVRLRAAADLGSGYFFKAMVMSEEAAGGFMTLGNGNSEKYNIQVSNFVFGRMMQDSHWMMGRLPLNSMNNPIFDLTLYPIPTGSFLTYNSPVSPINASSVTAVDVPVALFNFDRIFGLNYGTKIGNGDLNATLVVFDNAMGDDGTGLGVFKGDGLFEDGYALHLSYKTNIGSVTFEPQAIIALTDGNGSNYVNVAPMTFGANITIPSGKAKIGMSGFYTFCNDDAGLAYIVAPVPPAPAVYAPVHVDYSGYFLRLKGEVGGFTAWVDYNHTDDNTWVGAKTDYDNFFVWAQYKFNIYEAATGTFSLTPTVRYRASTKDVANGAAKDEVDQLRAELYATVTF